MSKELSSSSKVAALVSNFQSNKDVNQRQDANPGHAQANDSTPKGRLKFFKNSVQIRRTSSQVARFSSAKKVFEMKDKESSLNLSHSDSPVSKPPVVSPPLSSTLPQKLLSSGSKIPIGEFWKDNRGKKVNDRPQGHVGSNKENVDRVRKTEKVKSKHVKKYEALAKDVGSPGMDSETQFSGLLDNMFSPELRKAETDFEEIAQANISNDNILDTSADNLIEKIVPKIIKDSSDTSLKEVSAIDHSKDYPNQAHTGKSKTRRLQSTPKDSKSFQGFEVSSEEPSGRVDCTVESYEGPGYNASSLGSSMEGVSSSWLATTANTTDDALLNTKDSLDDAKKSKDVVVDLTLQQENVESSDYVSGDSCDIISPQPTPVVNIYQVDKDKEENDADFGNDNTEEDIMVHFLADGHYWYEGSPLEIIGEEFKVEDKPSKVRFSSSPIKHFSTFSNDDYDRRNEDVDPAGATAVYELEKRLEKMKSIAVDLVKEEAGLGISVLGVGVGPVNRNDKLGIFIKAITPGGAADVDGRLKVGDQIVSVDDDSLVGVTQEEAAVLLRRPGTNVKMVVARNPYPTPDQVMELIKQCTDTECDSQEEQDLDLTTTTDTNNVLGLEFQNLEAVTEMEDKVTMMKRDDVVKTEDVAGEEEEDIEVIDKELADLRPEDRSILHVNELLEDQEEETRVIDIDSKTITLPPTEVVPCPSEEATDGVVLHEEVEEIPLEVGGGCCGYKAKYDKLLKEQSKTEEQLRQVNNNLKMVTEQMVSREKMMQSYMETVSQLCNLDSKAETGHDLLNNLLDLRQKLIRSPYIPPAPELDLPEAEFDKVIGQPEILESAPAKEKIKLSRRSLVYRRTKSKYSKSTLSQSFRLSSTTPANMEMFFRRTILRSSLPVNLQRSASCSESDGLSSASSIHSGQSNDSLDKVTAGKKRSKSLLKQMKRRMSFTNNKGY